MYIRKRDGAFVLADEALGPGGVLKDGYGLRVPLTFKDRAAVPFTDAPKGLVPGSASYQAYCQRISDAWKPKTEETPTKDASVSPQEAYERRQRDAWKR